MNEKLTQIQEKAIKSISASVDLAQIETLRIEFLGKKSELSNLMKEMGSLTPEERPIFGAVANEVRTSIETALAAKKNEFEKIALISKMEKEKIDVTIPGNRQKIGKIHPLNKVLNQIKDIFISMGFEIVDGPEIETDYYNFEALNIPKDHPARDTQDTFYIAMSYPTSVGDDGNRPSNGTDFRLGVGAADLGIPSLRGGLGVSDAAIHTSENLLSPYQLTTNNYLLRTQTSPVQIRTMEKKSPPIRIIAPGRVYRSDAVDATHSPIFHQIEGLVIDKGVTFGNLKGCLEQFVHRLYGDDVQTRFRPHHFQFTEPSAEMDISCPACHGKGCSVCKGEGWIEILGAGMVHRNVLKRGNIDHNEYSGFAFGLGLERIAMRALGVNDLRLFYENDIRFLEQF